MGWERDGPIAGSHVAECRRERLDVATERGEIDPERLREMREKLRIAVCEEREGTAKITVLVVMETDGDLDQALEDLALVAFGFSPGRLEKLVHLEEETMLEEDLRRGDRSGMRLAREVRRAKRAKRRTKPLGTCAERGQVAHEIGAEPRALCMVGEEPALAKEASRFFVESRAPGGVRTPCEFDERMHALRGVLRFDRLEQPFRDRVSESELHCESLVAAGCGQW